MNNTSYTRVSIYLSKEERLYVDQKAKLSGVTKSSFVMDIVTKCIDEELFRGNDFLEYIKRRKYRERVARTGCTIAYDPKLLELAYAAADLLNTTISIFISATINHFLKKDSFDVKTVYYAGDAAVDYLNKIADAYNISGSKSSKKTFNISEDVAELLQKMSDDTRINMSLLLNIAICNLYDNVEMLYADEYDPSSYNKEDDKDDDKPKYTFSVRKNACGETVLYCPKESDDNITKITKNDLATFEKMVRYYKQIFGNED